MPRASEIWDTQRSVVCVGRPMHRIRVPVYIYIHRAIETTNTQRSVVRVGRPMHRILVPVYRDIFTGPLRPQTHREEDFCLSGIIALRIAARVSSTFLCRQGNI